MTDGNGRTIPLSEPGTVVVFRRNRGVWHCDRALPFAIDEENGLLGLRRKMTELVAFLGDCRAFVAESASGAAFFELEKARCPVGRSPVHRTVSLMRYGESCRSGRTPPPRHRAPASRPRSRCPRKIHHIHQGDPGKRPEVSSKQVFGSSSAGGDLPNSRSSAITCRPGSRWTRVHGILARHGKDRSGRGPDQADQGTGRTVRLLNCCSYGLQETLPARPGFPFPPDPDG